jgi:hypothetical protein
MSSTNFRKVFTTCLAALVLACSWFVPADQAAREQVTSGLQRALVVFASARALGAVLSVVQNTQLDAKPLGFGVSVAPGQALQPMNELVKHFAAVMLVASVSFGIQLLLLDIGMHWLASALLSMAVLVALAVQWRGHAAFQKALRPVLVILLMVRFAVPLIALGNGAIYDTFMERGYRADLAAIEQSSKSALGKSAQLPAADEGMLDRLKRWSHVADMRAALEAMMTMAADWSRTIVQLISLFVLQTVLLPIAFLWAIWRLARLAAVLALPTAPVR